MKMKNYFRTLLVAHIIMAKKVYNLVIMVVIMACFLLMLNIDNEMIAYGATGSISGTKCEHCDGTGENSEDVWQCVDCRKISLAEKYTRSGLERICQRYWFEDCYFCGGDGVYKYNGYDKCGGSYVEVKEDCASCNGSGKLEDGKNCSNCGGDGITGHVYCDTCGNFADNNGKLLTLEYDGQYSRKRCEKVYSGTECQRCNGMGFLRMECGGALKKNTIVNSCLKCGGDGVTGGTRLIYRATECPHCNYGFVTKTDKTDAGIRYCEHCHGNNTVEYASCNNNREAEVRVCEYCHGRNTVAYASCENCGWERIGYGLKECSEYGLSRKEAMEQWGIYCPNCSNVLTSIATNDEVDTSCVVVLSSRIMTLLGLGDDNKKLFFVSSWYNPNNMVIFLT